MVFLLSSQPGSASAEKRFRESLGSHPWRTSHSSSSPDAVLDAIDQLECPPSNFAPKEIPLEPTEDFGDESDEPHESMCSTATTMTASTTFDAQITRAYNLFPSPPYSL